MANNGELKTDPLKNSKFYVKWQVSYTSLEENYNNVNFQYGLYIDGYDEWLFNAVRINSLHINGQNIVQNATFSNLKGNGYHELGNGVVKISHDGDGYKDFNITISGWLYGYGNSNKSKEFTLDYIPREAKITSNISSLTDEGTPWFTYDNPANASMSCWLEINPVGEHLCQRNLIGSSGKYTWNLTDEERKFLRQKVTTSNNATIRIGLNSTIGSTEYANYVDIPFSIVNADPIIDIFSYADERMQSIKITGDPQIIIRNCSELTFTIRATAMKEASILKYQVTINGETRDANEGLWYWGILNVAEDIKAILKVSDSRGNTIEKSIKIKVENWELPSAIVTLNRKNNFYSDTNLKVDATCSSLNNKNILDISFRYKKIDESLYSNFFKIENNVQTQINLDNNFSWNVQVIVQDLIGQSFYNLFLDRGTPILYIDRKRYSVGINGFPEHDNSFEVFGEFYVNGNKVF